VHEVKAYTGGRVHPFAWISTDGISIKFVIELPYNLWFESTHYDPYFKPGVQKFSNYLGTTRKFLTL